MLPQIVDSWLVRRFLIPRNTGKLTQLSPP
jgi:hypothetical protein